MDIKDCSAKRLNEVTAVRVVQVIEVIGTLGNGTEDDPMGSAVQYWDFSGNLLATLWGRPGIQQPLEPATQNE